MTEGSRLKPELAETVGTWMYLDCHCVESMANGAHITRQCGACGKNDLRFIHTLEDQWDLDRGVLSVCIECARILIGDVEWDIPGEAETEAKSKAEIHDPFGQGNQDGSALIKHSGE